MAIIATRRDWPEAPQRFQSADGRLVAVLDPDRCGVRLRGTDLEAWSVTLTRDGEVIHTGDPMVTPGGSGIAYDLSAPLDADVVYEASVGSIVITQVAVHTGGLPFEWGMVTPLADPDKGLMLRTVADTPTLGRSARQKLSAVPSSRLQAGGWDIPTDAAQGWTWLAGFPDVSKALAERDAIMEALSLGPVYFRPETSIGFPPMWALPGDVSATKQGEVWTVSCTLTPITAPATADLPAWAPGTSYARVAATRGSFTELARTSKSYLELVGF